MQSSAPSNQKELTRTALAVPSHTSFFSLSKAKHNPQTVHERALEVERSVKIRHADEDG